MRTRVHRERERLRALAARLDALSPLAVLSRGYSIVQTTDGRIVRRASEVQPGDQLRLKLHGGDLVEAQVTGLKPGTK